MASRPPNILLLITDQQRYPCHWLDEPGWLRELTQNDHELSERLDHLMSANDTAPLR